MRRYGLKKKHPTLFVIEFIGVKCYGSTSGSNPLGQGSIPCTPANRCVSRSEEEQKHTVSEAVVVAGIATSPPRVYTRGDKMKQQDFARLERYPNGDVIDLYNIHNLLTEKQIDRLSDDDWSRVQEYQDELRMMIYELGG